MHYCTVKTHAKLENIDSCETQICLDLKLLISQPIVIKLENTRDRP